MTLGAKSLLWTSCFSLVLTAAPMSSGDGITWAIHASGTTQNLGIVLTSPEGLNWTVQHTDDLNSLNSVTVGNGQIVAVGQNGTVAAQYYFRVVSP